jgi:ABC-type branched-subunit amino acid transport system permease subunit
MDAMKVKPFKSACIGAVIAMVICTLYLLHGPLEPVLRTPEPLWAQIVFWPGIYAGQHAHDEFHLSVNTSYVIGSIAMTVVGGLLGFAIGWIASRCRRRNAA